MPGKTPQTATSWEVAFLLAREIVSVDPAGEGTHPGSVLKILLLQFGVGAVIALGAWLLAGPSESIGFFLGTLVGVIPNAYLGMRIAGFGGATDAQALLRAAWAGEAGKLLLTVLLMAGVFAFVKPAQPGWFLVGFIVVQVTSWIALFVFRRG